MENCSHTGGFNLVKKTMTFFWGIIFSRNFLRENLFRNFCFKFFLLSLFWRVKFHRFFFFFGMVNVILKGGGRKVGGKKQCVPKNDIENSLFFIILCCLSQTIRSTFDKNRCSTLKTKQKLNKKTISYIYIIHG